MDVERVAAQHLEHVVPHGQVARLIVVHLVEHHLTERVGNLLGEELEQRPVEGDLEHGDGRAEHRQRQGVREAIQRSEEHTSELQSLMRISYAVFCLKKKKK